MADVFVSYARPDRERVASLVDALTQAGLSVWWDSGIGVGASFDREIERELDGAAAVVVVWSSSSVDSDWVRSEAAEAQGRDALVPILIDDVRPPLAFRRAETARMLGWPRDRGELERLVEAVHAKLSAGVSQAAFSSADRTEPEPREAEPASIAVLPLTSISADPGASHFVDGLTIEPPALPGARPSRHGPGVVVRVQGAGDGLPRDRESAARRSSAGGHGAHRG
jgi:hypothetical protein